MSGVALSVTDYVRHKWPISVPDCMPRKCLYFYLVAFAWRLPTVIMLLVTVVVLSCNYVAFGIEQNSRCQ